MAIERTFVAIKPDGVQRQIVGEVISRFEKIGLKIVGMKLVHAEADFAKKHYAEHVEKPFYKMLENYITSGPVVGLVLEGFNAIETVRKLVGATEPSKAAPGTIRGDYAHMNYPRGDAHEYGVVNIIHASANLEDAQNEVHLWFSDAELFTYDSVHGKFM
ncbi:MAG: nucleoside-diphosphate kinase [Candidatus Woesearchaeota archaeon]|jgi:nucleoside-diphosphate kinase|nr:nucleoside-diphosphate kinase [Candidatus Woesearchaeota archaeon]